MNGKSKLKTKIPAKAKERAVQVNRLQRSADEILDNSPEIVEQIIRRWLTDRLEYVNV